MEKTQEYIAALEQLEKSKDFSRLPLPKFYCDAKNIDFQEYHRTPTLKELLNTGKVPSTRDYQRPDQTPESEKIKQLEEQLEQIKKLIELKAEAPATDGKLRF